MNHHRVLLISHTPLFAEAVTNLLLHEDIEVVGAAHNAMETERYLREPSINRIVVELDDSDALQNSSLAQLWTHENIHSIVFLTRNNNRMTIHHCETVDNVSSAQLIQALLI